MMTTRIQNLEDLQDRRIMMEKKLPAFGYALILLVSVLMVFLVVWSTQNKRTPKLGSLTMEDIAATDAQFAGCYFDGLPEQPIERVSMKNVTITFDPNAEAGQAAMADNRPLVKKLAIYAENVKEIDLHNVKIEGYEGERLHFVNVGHFEED